MLNQIPRPVQVTLYKFFFLYVGIGILGALLSWAMSDFALLLLSIGVLIFGTRNLCPNCKCLECKCR